MKEITQDRSVNGHRISTAFYDADSKRIVIFCHGYRGTTVGPNRFFVTIARQLATHGISSLRFDQYGSGNSEGDFFDSSFFDWVETTKALTKHYLQQGYTVALLGHSMGGTTVIAAGSELPNLSAIVAWCPDPNIDTFAPPTNGIIEEGGQIVQASFWQEAYDAKIADTLPSIKIPLYIVQCTADEYVDEQNRNAISKNAQLNHLVENFTGYSHNKWTFEQSREIIDKSTHFLLQYFVV
ncbi:MAG: hypothetical protein RIQ54_643 [Candidatus Parcubacteria bacterium]|jgi:esterase/lipase